MTHLNHLMAGLLFRFRRRLHYSPSTPSVYHTSTTISANQQPTSVVEESVHENKMPDSSTKIDYAYPSNIQDDIDAVQAFASQIFARKCRKCNTRLVKSFSATDWMRSWDSGEKPSFCGAKCPNQNCESVTCLGCGNGPLLSKNKTQWGKHTLDWCCTKGRLFAVWTVLGRYDDLELDTQKQNTCQVQPRRNNAGAGKGTGYDAYDRGDYGCDRYAPPQLHFKETDNKTDSLTTAVFELIIALLPIEPGKEIPDGLTEMIELSFFQDRAAQLLRNDSLANVYNRNTLYKALFAFVEIVGTHKDTNFLVADPRYAKKKSAGLIRLSIPVSPRVHQRPLLEVGHKDSMSESLTACMKNLCIQADTLLKSSSITGAGFSDSTGQGMLTCAKQIIEVQKKLSKVGTEPTISMATSMEDTWSEFHAANRVEYITQVMQNVNKNYRQRAQAMTRSAPNRIRKIVMELTEMTTSLPLGIFVRAQEERPDVMKCLIIGPEGTPYEGGLFEFDIFCPAEYPHVSPWLLLRTTNGGQVYFNPNLYANGKVCLSLLGTWEGTAEQQWQPGKSTLLQVLVSIQGMIFNEAPLENEPGYKERYGPQLFPKHSFVYNQRRQALTVRFAMMPWLYDNNLRGGIWKDVVQNYFEINGPKILNTVRKWGVNNLDIRDYRGGNGGEAFSGYSCIDPYSWRDYRGMNRSEGDLAEWLDANLPPPSSAGSHTLAERPASQFKTTGR